MPDPYDATTLTWADARGTRDYRGYDRGHVVESPGRPALLGSADRALRGDAGRFAEVVLAPRVTAADAAMIEAALVGAS